jgi:hypothetical protein
VTTETGAPTLCEFLLARIAEDEDLARRAFDTSWPRYLAVTPESEGVEASVSIGTYGPKDNFRVWQREHATEFGWTIHESGGVVWDPARVLRECAAKRRIVAMQDPVPDDPHDADREWVAEQGFLSDVLRLLALPYADHTDYRAEWQV